MKKIRWQDYIAVNPKLHHGDPCFKGTRVPVAMIVGSLADGMTAEEITGEFPQLTPEHFQAALAYAAELMHQEIFVPLPVEEMAYAS